MQRVTVILVLALLTITIPQSALAQADAGQAFEAGKTAYARGQFDKARESFIKASRTDVRNPEVFLWLGRSHYQLGELDKAVEAWRTTLKLAPNEPYAAKMLKALRGELTKVDTRIRLIEVLQNERLYSTVRQQCKTLLKDKALTDAQRAKVMTLQTSALLEMGKTTDALAMLREVLLRYDAHTDKAETMLLMGRIKLRMGGKKLLEALATLKKVVAEHPKTPSAARAEYELIIYRIAQSVDANLAKALKTWISAHPNHRQVPQARKRLFDAYLALSAKTAKPNAASKLNVFDLQAIDTAIEIVKNDPRAQKHGIGIVQRFQMHLRERYTKNDAYSAGIAAAERLLKAPLPRKTRLNILFAMGRFHGAYALRKLTDLAKAGKLPDGPMPKVLADTVAVYSTIAKEYPAQTGSEWYFLAALADNVRNLAPLVPWPAKVTQPKAPHRWAVQLALPVIKAEMHTTSSIKAINVIVKIVNDCERFRKPPARGVALGINTKLLAAMSPDNSVWRAIILKQLDLLDAYAADVFADNIKTGKAQDNAKLTEHQKRLLAVMTRLTGRQVNQAPTVLKRLDTHLQPWVRYGHYALVEQAYTQLSAALPEAQKRPAQLAVAKLWVGQVAREHNRLTSAGLIVPRKLDPLHVKALKRCYELQAGLDEGNTSLVQARSVWGGIIDHYKNLEYFDIAAQAIKVKPAVAVDTANAYAQLQLAGLHYAQAQRELAEFLKQYKGKKKIVLTPAFKTAIADYKKFISDRPSNPLAYQAVNRIFHMAQFFEQHQAYDVAAGVYRDFAAFAAKVKVLSQAAPGAVSTVERAEFAAAGALYAKARNALQKAITEAKPQAAPPAKMSPEFTDAVGAYKTFIKNRPESALLGPAIRRIMSAALVYARADAWDVADTIYADLLKAKLALRRPERIEFCRGLCQLGKVMPEHAKQVLSALAITGEDGKGKGRGTGRPGSGAMISKLASGSLTSPTKTMKERAASEMKPFTKRLAEPARTFDNDLKKGDMLAMAAIRKQQHRRASQIAMLRDKGGRRYRQPAGQKRRRIAAVPVLSDAEIARREKAFASAYKIFQAIRKNYARTPTAQQARGEITVMISHWRTIAQWQRAAAMTEKFLADNPTDKDLPQLRLGIARDYLAWAAKPVKKKPSKQEMLAEVAGRFAKARTQLAGIVKDFSEEKSIVHQAQWYIASSFLTQARVVDVFSPTLARGQYVRGAKELQRVAVTCHDHPNIASVPQMLWNVSGELAGRGYYEEAMTVWNELRIHYPTHSLAQSAAMRIAQTYQNNLARPLRAAEAYLELNFARGGSDQSIQNAIFQIGSKLKNEKRWVEALHVLETFVDSFPRHPSAGQALTMVGQIHQANEAWEDAIAAYRRVIDEFGSGKWIRDAKWAIAECTINLSRWREAMSAYQTYLSAYPSGSQASEARRRIGVLKDLARYQSLVDEKGQRKAFDAQYQIAEIVLTKLSNPVKAIIEYRKVAEKWGKSHLADDATFKVGATYLAMGETTKAREALLAVALEYPNSPLADDALYMVGKSYEKEATVLAAVTRAGTLQKAKDIAQKVAYKRAQSSRSERRKSNIYRIAELKKAGKGKLAELEAARGAAQESQYGFNEAILLGGQAAYEVEAMTAKQLADRQDKINAALRKAVGAYQKAAKVAAADKADESLLRMAVIYAEKLKDSKAAMKTYMEIVRQFSGTAVAEDASWRIAQYYERENKYADAIAAYKAFLRNYRRSTRAGNAQFAIAENYEHLGKWVDAMDAYTNYINNFPSGPMVRKAKEQINWIKTYRL